MYRLLFTLAFTSGLLTTLAATGLASTGEDEPTTEPRFGEWSESTYQAGVVVTATRGPCRQIIATVPVPMDWPEQQVQIVDEEVSNQVKAVQYRVTDAAVRQMVVLIPYLRSGEEARAVVTFKVRRRAIARPAETSGLTVAKRPDRELKRHLGPSPYIESRHAKIRSTAREIVAEHEEAWQQVNAIYDYVWDHVELKEGPLRGALKALRDGYGDCEERTSLFIALCRAAGIPARTVWVYEHCYPEFHLQNSEGQGSWYPCEVARGRAFGGIQGNDPILQKGDNLRVPEKGNQRLRYASEFLKGLPVKGGGKPQVRFVSRLVE